ncbi:hypothetical protein Sango_1616800 [Sesamum angolense]|uniref:Uncharacterized protein n=1 Tax=Sesamum angolense TaxID=2727404 RepID=A0AAE2BRB1_9LAMI|nr:hypothetical protein Sango_1616800 [Sesamum angolense]
MLELKQYPNEHRYLSFKIRSNDFQFDEICYVLCYRSWNGQLCERVEYNIMLFYREGKQLCLVTLAPAAADLTLQLCCSRGVKLLRSKDHKVVLRVGHLWVQVPNLLFLRNRQQRCLIDCAAGCNAFAGTSSHGCFALMLQHYIATKLNLGLKMCKSSPKVQKFAQGRRQDSVLLVLVVV